MYFTNKKCGIIKLVGILLVILLMATVLGCNKESATGKTDGTQNQGGDSKTTYPLTIENFGRTLTIESKPQRVICFLPNSTEVMLKLGLGNLVIGQVHLDHTRGPLPELAKDYKNVKVIAYGKPSKEAVVAANPDFLYGPDWELGGENFQIDDLNNFGIKTYVSPAGTFPSDMKEVYEDILTIGKIFDVQGRAEEVVAKMRAKVEAIGKKTANVSKKPKVLIFDSASDTVFTGGPGLENDMIRLAGGINVFADLEKEWARVSYEEVLSRQPDVIIIHDYDVPSADEKVKFLKTHPILKDLEAVKNERFIIVPLENVFYGIRGAMTIETFAKGFYPDLF